MLLFVSVIAWKLLPIGASPHDDIKERAQLYWECVIAQAGELDTSGGSATEVAVASKRACREDRLNLQASIDAELIIRATSGLPDRTGENVMAQLEEELTGEAMLIVLNTRKQGRNKND